MTSLDDPLFDALRVLLENLNEMSWLVLGDAAIVMLAVFLVIFMFAAIMKGIGVILRR